MTDSRRSARTAPRDRTDNSETASLIDRLAPDRDLAEPVYRQLLRRLTQMIEVGEIRGGQSLPSERLLAAKLGLSRTTVRRCYEELRNQDYLSTHGRAGVAVKRPPHVTPQMGRLKGFTEEMRELGIEPSTRLLEHEIVTDRTVASLFGRPSTARFLRLIRLRLGDGIPMSREVAWYDLTQAPELADWDTKGSIYQFMQDRSGLALSHGEQTVEAVISSEVEAEVFELPQPGPCLLIKRKTYSAAQQLVEYVEGTFRGDAYAYRIRLDMK